jgi:valyl-tRNA synthetase
MSDHADGKSGLAQTAMDAVTDGRVKILPERYGKSSLDWLGEKRDWPVRRQLWWGHQIPVWAGSAAGFQPEFSTFIKRLEGWIIQGRVAEFNRPISEQVESRNIEALSSWFICVRDEADNEVVTALEEFGLQRDPDVLDTWFSSALWPHSTFGWPEQTPELAYWYPTSVLITSRDIITLWVARMVLTGLNNMHEIPFHEVFIHPKILDGYGETMSKSKGNGVDPLDVIEKFGADALRFGLASLCTETQDVRMPVQFECPHCNTLVDQTKQNRELPRIKCSKCGSEFSTQWARKDEDKALPRGPVVSERFEVARNFSNKLWNAARFSLINLEGFTPGPVDTKNLSVEDRWLLSRLATVTHETTDAMQSYRYADAAKSLYDFAWDEFCSFYIEMAKPRLQDPAQRTHAQRLLAHALDTLLRLLHPLMPFITEEMWQNLSKIAPSRGLTPQPASEFIITAPWPTADLSHQDRKIEQQFAIFQQTLGAIREIRNRQNISMKSELEFYVQCPATTAELLQPMTAYFQSMANARAVAWSEAITPPATHAKTSLGGIDIFVDLKDFIDVAAEIAKNEKEEQRLTAFISSKAAKLSNESFVARAPANVVETERAALKQAEEQLASVKQALATLRPMKK